MGISWNRATPSHHWRIFSYHPAIKGSPHLQKPPSPTINWLIGMMIRNPIFLGKYWKIPNHQPVHHNGTAWNCLELHPSPVPALRQVSRKSRSSSSRPGPAALRGARWWIYACYGHHHTLAKHTNIEYNNHVYIIGHICHVYNAYIYIYLYRDAWLFILVYTVLDWQKPCCSTDISSQNSPTETTCWACNSRTLGDRKHVASPWSLVSIDSLPGMGNFRRFS